MMLESDALEEQVWLDSICSITIQAFSHITNLPVKNNDESLALSLAVELSVCQGNGHIGLTEQNAISTDSIRAYCHKAFCLYRH